MDKIKNLFITVTGILLAYFRLYLPLIAVVSVAVLLDIVTGSIAAVYTGEGLSSKKAWRGALKKLTAFLSLGLGIFLDMLIPAAAARLGFEMTENLLFSTVIAFYIAFSECVSVCENIFRCNPDAFPKWIVRLLTDGIKHIEKKGDKDATDKK